MSMYAAHLAPKGYFKNRSCPWRSKAPGVWRTGCDHAFGVPIDPNRHIIDGVDDPLVQMQREGFHYCPGCGLRIVEGKGQDSSRERILAGIEARRDRRAEEEARDEALLKDIKTEIARESAVALYRERHPDSKASDEEAFDLVLKALDKAGVLVEEQ